MIEFRANVCLCGLVFVANIHLRPEESEEKQRQNVACKSKCLSWQNGRKVLTLMCFRLERKRSRVEKSPID